MRYSILLFSILVALIFYLSFQNGKKEPIPIDVVASFEDTYPDKKVNFDSDMKIGSIVNYRETFSSKVFWIEVKRSNQKMDLTKRSIQRLKTASDSLTLGEIKEVEFQNYDECYIGGALLN